MKNKLDIQFDALTAKRFPVYAQYDGQLQPQPAYLELDIRSGVLNADYSGEIGNAVPFPVYHNLILRFSVPATSHRDFLAELIETNKELFQQVLDGAGERWDGNNNVGCFDGEAQSALDKLIQYFEIDPVYDGQDRYIVDDLSVWLVDGVYSKPEQSLKDYAVELLGFDEQDGCYFSDELANIDGMTSAILDIWENNLYRGDDIPTHVAKQLIENERGVDSGWVKELKQFAGA